MKECGFLITLMMGLLSVCADACAVCANGDNTQLIEASNSVLWTLLGLVGFIFVATGATVLFLWRNAKNRASQPVDLIPNLHPAEAAD
jgi:hypothetical protein